jgi:hypothetical protein
MRQVIASCRGFVRWRASQQEGAPGVGWSDPARADTGKTRYTLYLEARIVSFGRVTDRRKVADLPGADTGPGAYVAFRLNTSDAVDRALGAARAVKR